MDIYDNSNISESYAGVTTPLTFSFVRRVYSGVYRHFSKMMGAGNKTIKKNEHLFDHMVEFIGGRIYYNLNSWYKMLSFFPGHRFSGEFMEKMMGVEKKYSQKKEETQRPFQKYFVYFPKVLFQTMKISVTFLFLSRKVSSFNDYFDDVYSDTSKINLKRLNAEELRKHYLVIEKRLLSNWKVPIANDFAVMVSAGLANKVFNHWLKSNNAYAYMKSSINRPLISLGLGEEIMKIAGMIKKDKEINSLFLEEEASEILTKLKKDYSNKQVIHGMESYLSEFGTRMPNELKLETATLEENPVELIVLIKSVVEGGGDYGRSSEVGLETREYEGLSFLKKVILDKLLTWAGNSMYRREETRFRRALIFGHVRKIFLAFGADLKRRGNLEEQRDIFFLTMDEVFSSISEKHRTKIRLKSIVKKRKQKNAIWMGVKLPRRIETHKSIAGIEKNFLDGNRTEKKASKKNLKGDIASMSGKEKRFAGIALTMKEFDPAANFKGKILIAKQTDPGWTMIFPLLKGIVVERGGMLSHAAVVARELKIPCIVGVQGATNSISSGEQITMDLEFGSIIKTNE